MKKGIKLYVCKILVGMSLILLCGCSCGEDDSRIASSDETSAVNSESTSMDVTVSGDVSEEDTTNIDEEASREQESREQESREQESREQESREQESKEQASREQASREQESREQASREQASKEHASREQASKEQASKEVVTKKPAIDDKGKTPYEAHGRLQVSGTKLVDQYGTPYQLKGASTHGMAWFPQYVSYDTFKYMRDSFGVNVVRLAMYTAEYNGYCEGGDKNYLKSLVKQGVQAATDLGLYVIIDWHILHDLTPHKYKSDAIEFFREMSNTYKVTIILYMKFVMSQMVIQAGQI